MAKLIYIISTGHSGSTLLDILLGTFPEVFSTGEFRYFTWQLFRTQAGEGSTQKENVCTCRRRFQECEVWSEVIKRINRKKNIDVFKNPKTFNTSILTDFKFNDKTKLWNRLISKLIAFEMFYLPFKPFSFLFKPFYINEVKNVWQLIDTVGEITNSEYIVDSTKGLVRYYLLKQHRPKDTYLIINNRDSKGYAVSYLKRNIPPGLSLRSQKKHIKKVNRMVSNLKANYFKTIYEDFAKNPEKTLKKISNWLGFSFNSKQLENIDTRNYHLVAGNPTRYRGNLEIKLDETWKNKLTPELKNEISYYAKKYKLTDDYEKQ